MAVVDYGFPSRTFFELYAGEHPSEKIYSVQVADWKKYFSKSEIAHGQDVQRDVYDDPNIISLNPGTVDVVQVDMDQSLENRGSHLKLEPTANLIENRALRGVDVPDTISVYLNPAAVVQVDMDQSLENRASHLKVEPTADLIDFLASRGVDVPDVIYVQPLAFAWSRQGDFDVDEEIVEIPEEIKDDKQKSNSKTAAIIAALVAALSFLS